MNQTTLVTRIASSQWGKQNVLYFLHHIPFRLQATNSDKYIIYLNSVVKEALVYFIQMWQTTWTEKKEKCTNINIYDI